jgi:hypothetical protein
LRNWEWLDLVILEHCQVLPWVVNDEGMSVNEAVYTVTVGPDGTQ